MSRQRVLRVELVPEPAEPVIGHRQQRRVAFADVLDRLRVVLHDAVIRPVVERAVPGIAVHFEVLRHDVERLVRVEEFELQEPVVALLVVVEPADGVLDAARAGELVLLALGEAVESVLAVVRLAAHAPRGAPAGRRG